LNHWLLRHDPQRGHGRGDPSGKTILEALNTDLVCDAINTAMRELFRRFVYGRTQTAFSEGGLPSARASRIWARACAARSGTMYGTVAKGVRYLEMAEGYVTAWRWRPRRGSSDTNSSPGQDDGIHPKGRGGWGGL